MIDVAITQWGHSELTIMLLDVLIESDYVNLVSICDNYFSDAETDSLKVFLNDRLDKCSEGESPKVKLIQNGVNSGFSHGMNLAITDLVERGANWIWVLNNDVRVSESDIEKISKYLDNATYGILSTSIQEEGGKQFSGSYQFSYLTTCFKPIESLQALNNTPQRARYICGASMLIHRSVFEDVGMLNPRTFLYFEELDFFSRARSFGYYQNHIAGPIIRHLGSASSNGKSMSKVRVYHETISMLDHYKHHCPVLLPAVLFIRTPLKLLRLLFTRRARLVSHVVDAIIDFLYGRNRDLKLPQQIIKSYFRK